MLVRIFGAGRLDDIGSMILPEQVFAGGIQRVVQRRLDRISPDTRPMLELAAVLGRQLDLTVLNSMWERRELDHYLQSGTATAILEVQDNQWRFSHDKVREFLLSSLSSQNRKELHAKAASAIEGAYPDAARQSAVLAYHWGAAADTTREARYSALAGEQAFRAAAYREATRFLQRALALYENDPNPPFDTALVERLLGEAFFGMGNMDSSRQHLERAAALLGHAVPATQATLVFGLLRQSARQLVHRKWSTKFVGHARDIPMRGKWIEVTRTFERLGHVHYHQGDNPRTLFCSLSNVNAAERVGISPELARAYATQIVGAGMVPLHGLANLFKRLAQSVVQQADQPTARAWVSLLSGVYLSGVGRWPEAEALLADANAMHLELGDKRRWEEGAITHGVAIYYQGKWNHCEPIWRDVLAGSLQSDDAQAQSWALLGEATVAIARNEIQTAIQRIGEAMKLSINEWPVDEIWLYGLSARAHLYAGQPGAAAQAASKGSSVVSKSTPTGFHVLEGYSGIAETYLALLENAALRGATADVKSLRVPAMQNIRALGKFGKVFPVGESRTLMWEGLYSQINGQSSKAESKWRASIAAAEKRSMPYDLALAHYQWGRHNRKVDERKHHLKRARELFADLHANYHVGQVETALLDGGSPPTMT